MSIRARQPEMRVVVVEADMRRPALARTLGQKGIAHQFSRVLAGQAPWAEHMLRIGPNLVFATNAAPVNHSAELLQSATARRALEEVEQALDPSERNGAPGAGRGGAGARSERDDFRHAPASGQR